MAVLQSERVMLDRAGYRPWRRNVGEDI